MRMCTKMLMRNANGKMGDGALEEGGDLETPATHQPIILFSPAPVSTKRSPPSIPFSTPSYV